MLLIKKQMDAEEYLRTEIRSKKRVASLSMSKACVQICVFL